MIRGVNHITLACADLDRAITFYTQILGARLRARWETGAYLELGPLWLCLAVGPVVHNKDYSHVALDCAAEDFATLSDRIARGANLWQDNRSEGQSLYFLDPDGHRLELHVGDLTSRLMAYGDRTDIQIHP